MEVSSAFQCCKDHYANSCTAIMKFQRTLWDQRFDLCSLAVGQHFGLRKKVYIFSWSLYRRVHAYPLTAINLCQSCKEGVLSSADGLVVPMDDSFRDRAIPLTQVTWEGGEGGREGGGGEGGRGGGGREGGGGGREGGRGREGWGEEGEGGERE